MGFNIALIIPMMALAIPIVAITLAFRHKTQRNKLREMELQKEILELEVKKQESRIKLLEAENKNLDKVIFD